MRNKIFILLVVAIVFTQGHAQLKIGGEIRTRSELNDGAEKPLTDGQDATFVTNSRSRLYIDYRKGNLATKVVVQDTRTLGSVAPGTLATNTTGLYEAWGQYAFNEYFSFTIGRQILEWDDKRLFSASNWSNTGNAHDALLLDYSTPGFRLNVAGGWNNTADNKFDKIYTIDKSYKSLLVIRLSKQAGIVNIAPIYVNESFQYENETNKLYRHYRNTVGGNILISPDKLPFSVYGTAYYQFGRDNKQNKLNASLLAIKADYRFHPLFTLQAGVDYLSGSDKELKAGHNHTFNKLYGSNHNFNGSLEYWKNPPVQGLLDKYAGVTFKPSGKIKVNGTFHAFSLVKEHAITSKKGLGSELDLTVDYQLASQLAIQGGWSAYFRNNTTEVVKGLEGQDTRFPHWAYLMLSFKF